MGKTDSVMVSLLRKYCLFISLTLSFWGLLSFCAAKESAKARSISVLIIESREYPQVSARQLKKIFALAERLLKLKLGESVSYKVVDTVDSETYFSDFPQNRKQDSNKYFFNTVKFALNGRYALEDFMVVFPGDREAFPLRDVVQFLPSGMKEKASSYDDALKASFSLFFKALKEADKGKVWGKSILKYQKIYQHRPDCFGRVWTPKRKYSNILLTNVPLVSPFESRLHLISQVIVPATIYALSVYPYVANMDFGTLRKFNEKEQVLFLAKNLAELTAQKLFRFPDENYAPDNKECLTYNGYVLKDKAASSVISSIVNSGPCKYEADFMKWRDVLRKIMRLTEAKNYTAAYKQVVQLNKQYTFPKQGYFFGSQIIYTLWNAVKVGDNKAVGKYKALLKKYLYYEIQNANSAGMLGLMLSDLDSKEKKFVEDIIKVGSSK